MIKFVSDLRQVGGLAIETFDSTLGGEEEYDCHYLNFVTVTTEISG
jgi:hypothetical protein